MTTSLDGREWAHYSQLKPGDKVIVDEGFEHTECGHMLKAGTICEVKEHSAGLYIECCAGVHLLDGQRDDDDPSRDSLVGIWPTEILP